MPVGIWYDVALIVLLMLRPLRLLRLLALARILNRAATNSLVGKVSTDVFGTALMSTMLAAIAVLDVERDARDSNITTFGGCLVVVGHHRHDRRLRRL